jgi:hypothetical protein
VAGSRERDAETWEQGGAGSRERYLGAGSAVSGGSSSGRGAVSGGSSSGRGAVSRERGDRAAPVRGPSSGGAVSRERGDRARPSVVRGEQGRTRRG